MKNTEKGFTLIEILVVIGIIAILAAVVLIAINPARQFAQANDSQRNSNVTAILNAIGQFAADNQGALPSGLAGGAAAGDPDVDAEWVAIDYALGTTGGFCDDLVPTYMPALPVDPASAAGAPIDACTGADWGDTLYEVIQDEDTNRISVRAAADIDTNDDGDLTNDYIMVTR